MPSRAGTELLHLDASGWQHEYWLDIDPGRLPAALVRAADGRPLTITVPIGTKSVVAQVWRVAVGRVPLFFSTDHLPANVADPVTHLEQYVLLGVGGVRALAALGIEPSLLHLNQGHAALAVLELTRRETARGASVDAALEVARRRTVFTTHTPVGAGNETFPRQQLLGAIGGLVAELGVDPDSSCGSGATAPTTTASHSGSHSSACG